MGEVPMYHHLTFFLIPDAEVDTRANQRLLSRRAARSSDGARRHEDCPLSHEWHNVFLSTLNTLHTTPLPLNPQP